MRGAPRRRKRSASSSVCARQIAIRDSRASAVRGVRAQPRAERSDIRALTTRRGTARACRATTVFGQISDSATRARSGPPMIEEAPDPARGVEGLVLVEGAGGQAAPDEIGGTLRARGHQHREAARDHAVDEAHQREHLAHARPMHPDEAAPGPGTVGQAAPLREAARILLAPARAPGEQGGERRLPHGEAEAVGFEDRRRRRGLGHGPHAGSPIRPDRRPGPGVRRGCRRGRAPGSSRLQVPPQGLEGLGIEIARHRNGFAEHHRAPAEGQAEAGPGPRS